MASLLGVLDGIRAAFEHFSHISVLLFNFDFYSSFAVSFIEEFSCHLYGVLSVGKFRCIVISDYISESCVADGSAHSGKMVEALVILSSLRTLGGGKERVKLHGNQRCVNHHILG